MQSLSVVRNCFVEFAVFFQERAIAVVRLGGPGGQSNGRFAFGSRLVVVTELLQNISIAGMILGIVGLDSQRDSNVTGGGVSAAALERNAIAAIVNVACVIATVHIILSLSCGEQKRQNAPSVKEYATTLAILALLSATLALAEDFKTVRGKLYKDATIIRVESDGIVLKTKTGISKVYFVELPNDVQERFHPSPAKTAAAQRQREPIKLQGWAAVMANPTAVVMFFVAGTIIIAGVVFAIVRRRFQ